MPCEYTKTHSPSNMLICLMLVFVMVNAEELVIDSTDKCGEIYILDTMEPVYIRYKGGLLSDECSTKFTITSTFNYIICAQPLSLNLDCNTQIEYHKHVVIYGINNGVLNCDLNNLSTYNESCAKYVSSFYVVIRNGHPFGMTNETADIRVYAKERRTTTTRKTYPDYDTESTRSGTNYAYISVLPGIIIVFICAVSCAMRRRRQQFTNSTCTNTNINYTTATGTTTVNTGYPQAPVPINTVQQSVSDFQVHPTMVAYQLSPAPPSYNYPYAQQSQATNVVKPSAPAQDAPTGPPPSYESLQF